MAGDSQDKSIWKFIDLAIAKDELPYLAEPTIPTPQDVNPDKTSLAQLDDDEKEELRFQRLSYKRKIATFDRQKAGDCHPTLFDPGDDHTYLSDLYLRL
jgi:hypothetical protein